MTAHERRRKSPQHRRRIVPPVTYGVWSDWGTGDHAQTSAVAIPISGLGDGSHDSGIEASVGIGKVPDRALKADRSVYTWIPPSGSRRTLEALFSQQRMGLRMGSDSNT